MAKIEQNDIIRKDFMNLILDKLEELMPLASSLGEQKLLITLLLTLQDSYEIIE